MRPTFLRWMLLLALAQLSCNSPPVVVEDVVEAPAPELLQTSSWPDAPDLGVVVFSGVIPLETPPPPPDFER